MELLGSLFGDAGFPTCKPRYARDVRRSVIHHRLVERGADFMVLTGYEVPEWFADARRLARAAAHVGPRPGVRRPPRSSTRAVREAVGVMDMSFMAKILVQGPGALALLDKVSVSRIDVPIGKIVYTQWLTPKAGSGPT